MLFSFILLCQVYIIKVSWSDGSTEAIYRRYSKFFDLQVSEPLTVCVCVVIFEFLLIVLNVFFHFCRFGGLFVLFCASGQVHRAGKAWKHCLSHTRLVLVASLSLLHPYNPGNYIVRDESENSSEVNRGQWWMRLWHWWPQKCLNHSQTSWWWCTLHNEGVLLVS